MKVDEAPAAPASAPAAATTPASAATKSDDDLLKEFESAVEKEMGIKPTPNAKPAPLEVKTEDINSNKLVEEMEALASVAPPEVKDDGKDSNQKLIEEFENFVNKN